jgi:branched-chain amino acid aminotransferase
VPELISVNGRLSPPREAAVSPLDRGFLFGDSVYETIRTYGMRPFRLDRHLERLRLSAGRLDIPHDDSSLDLERECLKTIKAAGIPEAAVRVILTRGAGPVTYDPETAGPPTLVIHVRDCPVIPAAWRAEGVDVAIVGVVRNSVAAIDPAIKCGNLLNNLLAWKEARRLGAYEAILLNGEERLAEGSSSNVFLARRGRLYTPETGCGILAGITRQAVIDLAREDGVEVIEGRHAADDLRHAEEAFITSTLKGVLPVRRCDGWPVNDGRPGPLTRRVMTLFDRLVQAETNAGSSPGSSLR